VTAAGAYVSFWKARPRIRTPAGPRAAYALAARHHPRFKRAYRVALDEVRTPELLSKLGAAVRNKSVLAVDYLIPPFDPTNPELAARWAQAYEQLEARYRSLLYESGKQELGRLRIDMSFRLQNPYSLAWIEQRAGNLIQAISEQARHNIRNLIYRSFADGVPPNVVKQMIKGHIGLLPKEAAAVERRLASALAEKVPQARAAALAERYAEKLLDSRAERIARTETIAAEAQGQLDSWRTARDSGYIVDGTRREWVASSEANGACPDCAAMDGAMTALDAPFQTRFGEVLAPPLHVNCRCTVVLVSPGDV